MSNIEIEIQELIRGFKQLPYLFIGTGISRRYSTAPSWDELLYNTWVIVNGENEDRYKKFVNRISHDIKLDTLISDEERKYRLNPRIATEIQKQFNHKYFEDDEFEKKVFLTDESKEILDNNYDPFKAYIAKMTRDLTICDSGNRQEVLELEELKKNQNKIAGIITTNYDLILENIFSDFDVLIGQDSMLTSNMNNIFEVFKIHGSSNDPSTIVITQDDYDYFHNKLKYLSAKLLTLFVEHPIIFIGYSIGDLNIRSILKEIAECLNKTQLDDVKNNFIFISPSFGEREEIKSKEIEFDGKKIIMTEIVLKDYSILFKSLSIINSSMPVRIMRKMQDMFCKFIASTEANNNIIVGNINDNRIDDNQYGIYFGNIETVSTMGFDYFGINDIIEDILFDNKKYLMNKQLIDKTFKNIRSIAGGTYLPVYKYLKGLSINVAELPSGWKLIKSKNDMKLTKSEKMYTHREEQYTSIKQIEKEYSNHIPKLLAYIRFNILEGNIETEDLGEWLRVTFTKPEVMNKGLSTYKKLVATYDYMKYSKK